MYLQLRLNYNLGVFESVKRSFADMSYVSRDMANNRLGKYPDVAMYPVTVNLSASIMVNGTDRLHAATVSS